MFLNNWFVQGVLAALSFSGMVLVYKKLFLLGIKPLALNLFMFGFVFVGFMIWNIAEKTPLNITTKMTSFLVLASLFSLAGNYFYTSSVANAPNPGFAATLKAGEIVLITLLSFFIFKSSLNAVSFLGVIMVLFGVFLISK